MELFKGYIDTKGNGDKAAVRPYKNNAILFTLEQVQHFHSYSGIIKDEFVLVDFDIEGEGKKFLKIVNDLGIKCRAYETTRGFHFYFRNEGRIKKNGDRVKVACGLRPDFKIGGNLGTQKLDGKVREIVYDVEGDYDILPNILLPISKKCDIELKGLKEGDGRNSELFRYIPILQTLGLSNDEVKEVGRVINKYIFEKPLSEDEFNTVFRDEAFVEIAEVNNFQDKNGFRHDLFGDYLISENNIVRINDQLYTYRNGIYVNTQRDIELAMIQKIPKLRAAQRAEVIKYIDIKAEIKNVSDAKYIAFKNGIYNLAEDRLIDFSPDIVVTNQIPWDYNENAYSELAENTLRKIACNKDSIIALLEECIGYCFYRRNQLGKAFFLTGGGSNGKSTFLDMMNNLLGSENISSLDIAQLEERFSVAEIAGKLANVGDDISDEFLQGRAVATFKKIVTGDRIKAEKKGENPFMFNPYAKMFFSANDIPRSRDRTGAVLRRMVIIPFNAVFSDKDKDYDPYLKYKLEDELVMQYLIKVGLEGLKRVVERRKFTEPLEVKVAKDEYELDNNPILAFLEEVSESGIENQITNSVYSRYKVFCVENSTTPMSKTSFSREIKRRYGMVTKVSFLDGKSIRMYVKEVKNS